MVDHAIILDLCPRKREVQKSLLKNIAFKEQPKNSSYRRCGKKREKKKNLIFFPQRLQEEYIFFFVANCVHGDRNQLVRRSTLDVEIDSAHGQPAWYLARTNIDDGLEGISRNHGLGDESLPAGAYEILRNIYIYIYIYIYIHILNLPFETDEEVVSSVSCKPAAKYFFNHKPGQLPPHT